MKLRELIEHLQKIKNELMDKEVYIVAPNGIKIPPDVVFVLKDIANYDKTKENVEYILFK